MLARLRSAWRELHEAPPGRRFEQRFQRRRDRPRGALRKALWMGGGMLLVLIGVIALPLPGPGLLIIALGLLPIAEESRLVARALDALELKLRRLRSSGRPRAPRRGIL